jgi:hypothetical protein
VFPVGQCSQVTSELFKVNVMTNHKVAFDVEEEIPAERAPIVSGSVPHQPTLAPSQPAGDPLDQCAFRDDASSVPLLCHVRGAIFEPLARLPLVQHSTAFSFIASNLASAAKAVTLMHR